MIKPHHYGFAAYELYGEAAPSITINDVGVFFTGDTDALIPAPQDLLARAAQLAAKDEVPRAVSDRQFFQALWKRNYITKAEMVAAVKVGDIPAQFQAVINALPPQLLPPGLDIDDVEVLVMGATTFERHHPVTQIIAATFGWSSDDADEFWRYAASL
jgi:hypothetical protein